MNEELSDVPDITATELAVRLDAGDVPVLLDVREHYEAEIADLPEHGQVRIPTGEFAELLEELDRHGEPVIYCTIGSRSAWATRLLPQSWCDRVFDLLGSILAWREEVDPSLMAY